MKMELQNTGHLSTRTVFRKELVEEIRLKIFSRGMENASENGINYLILRQVSQPSWARIFGLMRLGL